MGKPRSISKKTRFEVFKRDGFQCGYCGKTPPEITLEVDHIIPVSKDGSSAIENLISACFDCNRGKRNIPLDKAPNPLAENLEVLKERELQIKEFNKFVKRIEKRIENDIEEICGFYNHLYPGWWFSERFVSTSLRQFLQRLPKHEIIDALRKTASKIYTVPMDENGNGTGDEVRYFCGVCWSKIRERENG